MKKAFILLFCLSFIGCANIPKQSKIDLTDYDVRYYYDADYKEPIGRTIAMAISCIGALVGAVAIPVGMLSKDNETRNICMNTFFIGWTGIALGYSYLGLDDKYWHTGAKRKYVKKGGSNWQAKTLEELGMEK